MNVNIKDIGNAIVGIVKVALMLVAILTLIAIGNAGVHVSNSLDRVAHIGLVLHHNQLGGKGGTLHNDKGGTEDRSTGPGGWKFKKNPMSILQCYP